MAVESRTAHSPPFTRNREEINMHIQPNRWILCRNDVTYVSGNMRKDMDILFTAPAVSFVIAQFLYRRFTRRTPGLRCGTTGEIIYKNLKKGRTL